MSLSSWEKFRALTTLERLLLVEATCALAVARLALLCFPFRWIAGWFGHAGSESGTTISSLKEAEARHVGRAVETMANHVPWKSLCLVKAISAWWMLSRRGITGTVYFGVANDPCKSFSAHAWLRCGDRIVTGEKGYKQYRVLACFSKGER